MKNFKHITAQNFLFGLVLFALISVSVLGLTFFVRASSSDNLSGYAWSSTIGWVSMNCTTGGSCGTSNYGVSVDGNGLMSGYAWSSNAGWVSFNNSDLTGCPTAPCEARFDKTTGFATGWARALAGAGADYETGGWGGWLHLAGTGHQVKAVGCSWEGYAWGGGSTEETATVGWLSFKGTNYGVAGSGVACRETPAQCNDGLDNDLDGLADYPSDPGCTTTADDSETTSAVAQCADGLDNDGDSKIDYSGANTDPGCTSASDDSETDPPLAACQDSLDNDTDGLVDYPSDPGCVSSVDTSEVNPAQCEDSLDNDGDTYVDYPNDPGCIGTSDNNEYNAPQCSDGIDNDGDTRIDYPTDLQCSSTLDNSESATDAELTLYPTSYTIRPGQTTTLHWSVVDVQANSCTLSGNGDSWSLSGSSGTEVTNVVSEQVTYTLRCTDLGDQTVSVSTSIRILPKFEEI